MNKDKNKDLQEIANDQTETFYGKQSFTNKKGDTTTYGYQFETKADLQWWQHSDIKAYQPNSTNPREALTPKEFQSLLSTFKKEPELFKRTEITNTSVYGHIRLNNQPEKLGIVVRFDNDEQRTDFAKQAVKQENYQISWQDLSSDEPKVIAAVANKAILNAGAPQDSQTREPIPGYKINEERFNELDIRLKTACKYYPLLDPAKNSLVLIAQKNWKNPIVTSFENKTLARNIVQDNKQNQHVHVKHVGNFNGVAISATVSRDRTIQSIKSLNDVSKILKTYVNLVKTINQDQDKIIIKDGKIETMNLKQFNALQKSRGQAVAKPTGKKTQTKDKTPEKATAGMSL